MEPASQAAEINETEPDGNGDMAGGQQHGVPKLHITPATAESTPAPPDAVDENLLLPPPVDSRDKHVSPADESSLAPMDSASDESAATNPSDGADLSPPPKQPRARNDRKSPFTAKFFGDMLNTIDGIFPYHTFAEEHGCTVGDVHRALMATVFTPLTDANERGKPRIADKGRSMMKKWNQRYKEMVKKLNEESNERQFPMEFEQVLIAASQNLDAYWESRNSGFEAYKAFQNTKKKQMLEDRSVMLKRAAERDAELTQEATEARRKRSKIGNESSSHILAAEGESSSLTINNNKVEHVDLTTDSLPTLSPTHTSASVSTSTTHETPKTPPKRHPVLVDAFGNYQDMPEAVSDYFDKQYHGMAAGAYIPNNNSNDFEDMDDDDEDGDYEEEGNGSRGKLRKKDSIDRMLDIFLRRSPRRRRQSKDGEKGEEGDGL